MHSTAADGGLRGHVPARPECITPHIRFLFIAPQFRIGLPSDPASRRRPCPSPCLRLCKTWPSDFHRRSNAPCLAHTFGSGGCAGLIAQLPCNAGFGRWRTQRYLPATANTAWGFVLAIASKVRAAPLGCLRPCSQPCKVRTDTPMSAANWD